MDSEDDAPVSANRRARRSKTMAAISPSSDDEELPHLSSRRASQYSDSSIQLPVKTSPKRPPTGRSFLSGGSTGNAPIPRGRKSKGQVTPQKRRSGRRQSHTSSDEDSLLEDIMVESPTRKVSYPSRRSLRSRKRTRIDMDEDSESDTSQMESAAPAKAPRARNGVAKESRVEKQADQQSQDDVTSEDDVNLGMGRTRQHRADVLNKESSDLEEDEDFLRDTGECLIKRR